MKETDGDALSPLGRALGALGKNLDATSAAAVAELIAAAMKDPTRNRDSLSRR